MNMESQCKDERKINFAESDLVIFSTILPQ